jgi:hypothetical protein
MSELEKTIEELEAEVLAELEEASQPSDSGGKADAPKKLKGNGEEGTEEEINKASPESKVMPVEKAVNDPDDALGAKAAKKIKQTSGDAQQKSAGKADGPQKLAASHEPEGEVVSEAKITKAQALEQIGKMKKSEIEEMLAGHAAKLEEAGNAKSEEELAALEAEKEAIEEKIKSINVKEDVDALVAGEDLSEEFKNKAATIFEAAVKSKIRSEVVRMEEGYAVSLEEATETIKEELSTKVDDYLSYVVEEWMKENELAVERGLKGEIAEDFITGLKQLFEDHYIDVPDEKYDVLESQSEKIAELEEKLNLKIEENVEKKRVVESLTREQIVSEVSSDLAITEIEKFKSLVEDVDFASEDSFKAKLDTLKESYFPTTTGEQSFGLDDDSSDTAQDIDTTESIKAYMSAISRTKSA